MMRAMKTRAAMFLPLACAFLGLAAGGCSLFHHQHKPKPWHPKPLGPLGPMEGNPQPMEAQPVEPQPRPMEPEPAEAQ